MDSDIAGMDHEMNSKFRKLMENNGVLILPENRWLMSFVLTDDDVEWTLEAAEDAIAQLAK
jgi:glutamate-1-semialdehyde aminotransferase